MDWKREAVDELRNYQARKHAISSIAGQIEDLRKEITSIRSASADGTPVSGGSNGRDDALVNNIMKRDKLKDSQKLTENRVHRIENALAQLSDRDRCVLQRFYIAPMAGGMERFCMEQNVEKTTAYRWKDNALRKFAIAMYGMLET